MNRKKLLVLMFFTVFFISMFSVYSDEIPVFSIDIGKYSRPRSLALSSDSRYIACFYDLGIVKIWDAQTGVLVRTIDKYSHFLNYTSSIIISPDNKYIIFGHPDKPVHVCDFKTGNLIHTLDGAEKDIDLICLSSDGSFIVGVESENRHSFFPEEAMFRVKIWEIESGKLVKTIDPLAKIKRAEDGKRNAVFAMCLSKDDSQIIYSNEKDIYILDIETERHLRVLKGHTSRILSLVMSKDGKYIISAGCDKSIRIWNFKTGRLVKSLEGHDDDVVSAVISPDNRYVFSSSDDFVTKLWDVELGKCIYTFLKESRALAFSADGNNLVILGSQWIDIVSYPLKAGLDILHVCLVFPPINTLWSIEEIIRAYTVTDTEYMTYEEKHVIFLMNLARLNGEKFAHTILQDYTKVKSCFIKHPDSTYVKSLFDDLKNIKNLPMLQPSEDLYNAAFFHAQDMGKTGKTGHNSSDGTNFSNRLARFVHTGKRAENCYYGFKWARPIVMTLLIDEGLQDLGHRKIILNKDLTYVGVSIQPHIKYMYNCVIDFSAP